MTHNNGRRNSLCLCMATVDTRQRYQYYATVYCTSCKLHISAEGYRGASTVCSNVDYRCVYDKLTNIWIEVAVSIRDITSTFTSKNGSVPHKITSACLVPVCTWARHPPAYKSSSLPLPQTLRLTIQRPRKLKLEHSKILSFVILLYCTVTNKCTQLFHKLSHSYMFRHCGVILRELVINTLPNYTREL